MLTTPTITFYNPISANANWYNQSASADSGAGTDFSTGANGTFLSNAQVVGDTTGQLINVQATAVAEL